MSGAFVNKMRTAVEFTRRNGILKLVQECYFQLTTRFYESYFNVDTEGTVTETDLKFADPDSCSYGSVHYRHMIYVLNRLRIDKEKSTLLDLGCGKGRAIITFSAHPFRKIIGVELSRLITIAEENLARMRHRKAKEVVLRQCNAKDFAVPSDVNIVYMYNPFRGAVLESVTRNICTSCQETPRKMYIIFFNNDHFDEAIAHQNWLTKISQLEFYPDISCGLYETAFPQLAATSASVQAA